LEGENIAPRPPISGQELHKAVRAFSKKPFTKWNTNQRKTVIDTLRKRSSIKMTDCPSNISGEVWNFLEEMEDWKLAEPNINKELDPYYVLFQFPNNTAPTAWNQSIAMVINTINPQAEPNSFGLYTVNGDGKNGFGNARQFAGFMMGRHPGVNASVFSCTNMVSC
jgi:hypothetical protein